MDVFDRLLIYSMCVLSTLFVVWIIVAVALSLHEGRPLFLSF